MTKDMGSAHQGRIVVATDGSTESMRAVAIAAQEAERRGAVLRLVHVVPTYVYPVVEDEAHTLAHRGREVLHDATRAAHEVAPGLRVTGTLAVGGRVGCIVDEARHADLVVLASRPLGRVARLWTGSTAAGVASRADCPVLVLPGAYEPTRAVTGRVAVGVRSSTEQDAVLRAAFATAAARGPGLQVLHAWRLDSGYDDVVTARSHGVEWTDRATQELAEAVSPLEERFPDVKVDLRVLHEQAAHALVEESADCDLLVIGRPTHGAVVHHLGGTARALLRDATCPVLVVPTRASGSEESDGLDESADDATGEEARR